MISATYSHYATVRVDATTIKAQKPWIIGEIVQLSDELIKELHKVIGYAARLVLDPKAAMTHEDSRGRLYNGCDYQEELIQSMLLKMLVDKGSRFERAYILGKKYFMNLVIRSARNMTIDYLRHESHEVPCSQVDTPSEQCEDDDYENKGY